MSRKKILIVDDERGFTAMLSLNLESLGPYEVMVENQATQALATAQAYRPDLILLDFIMPEIDGAQVAKAIKTDPQLKGTPIILMTAIAQTLGSNEDDWPGLDLPCVSKPSNLSTLLSTIQRHIV